MALALGQRQHAKRWGDLAEEDDGGELDLGVLLPAPVVFGPDAKGVKKVVDYRLDGQGSKVKVTTTSRVRKVRLPKRVVEHRAWAKFGDAAKEEAGSRLTVVSTEEILLEHARASGSKAGKPSSSEDDPLAKANDKPGGGLLMVCRTCKKQGDHWTSKCPYKDLAPPPAESSGDRPPSADGPPSQQQGGGKGGAYVPVFRRTPGFAEKSSADVMRRRNDENSIRVSNLPEDAHEPDLQELFGPFGPVSRIFVAVDRRTGEGRGFGFVNFVYREDGERAIKALDGHGYGNLIMHAEWSGPRPSN